MKICSYQHVVISMVVFSGNVSNEINDLKLDCVLRVLYSVFRFLKMTRYKVFHSDLSCYGHVRIAMTIQICEVFVLCFRRRFVG